MPRRAKRAPQPPQAESYSHPEAKTPLRPDVGVQAQFKKTKPPQTYRYDSSLSPALDWDGQNAAREQGETLLAEIAAQTARLKTAKNDKERQAAIAALEAATQRLKALGRPFLNWAGKAERLSFDVPTLPLFRHEWLSTQAILETLTGHRRDKQLSLFDLFGDPQYSIADQVLRAYEHKDQWRNRIVLGDSLVVMNSLLHYENLGGQVQMIYMDPPYGVKYGSNFQPFVRKRDVKHNDDEDMTREPEMVQAYRDTWEVGLHSYLTYLRDRLLLCRELLHPSGSIFVQISDENVHHVREVMEDVMGADNFIVTIFLKKKGNQKGATLEPVNDYLLWFAKDKIRVKIRLLFTSKLDAESVASSYNKIEMPDGTTRNLTDFETDEIPGLIASGARIFTADQLTSGGEFRTQLYDVEFEGKTYRPAANNSWKINEEAMKQLISLGRVVAGEKQIRFKKYLNDFPCTALTNLWGDLGGAADKIYVVQTSSKAVARCVLMTTDPGDLVLDPTCGSGTTAYVAEQWGRRWITIDVSRVPLALARQRLLTATFPWYELKNEDRGPAGGFVYKRKQNNRGEEVGGIVPHVTLKSIANNEPPAEEVLVDRPEEVKSITRVTGPFNFEATIPTAAAWEEHDQSGSGETAGEANGNFCDRMLEVLRKSPLLRLEGNRTVSLQNVRPPAKALSLSAEAVAANGESKLVAFVFGPENGAVSEKLVQEALREAYMKGYAHLYVIGFAIQPNARLLIDGAAEMGSIAATYVQATPDLLMGDLLKNMRSSQIFSVCGLPEIEVKRVKGNGKRGPRAFQVTLLGLDVFDPVTMESIHRRGEDVPAWFLDTDYNDQCFHVCQAFFPRTGAWENLKKALKGTYEEGVWDHLAGTTSAPFEPGENGKIAVKVIDDRGNELLVVQDVKVDK